MKNEQTNQIEPEELKELFFECYYFSLIALDDDPANQSAPEDILQKYNLLLNSESYIQLKQNPSAYYPQWPNVEPITSFGMIASNSLDGMITFIQSVLDWPEELLKTEDPYVFDKQIRKLIKMNRWKDDNEFYHETSKLIEYYKYEKRLKDSINTPDNFAVDDITTQSALQKTESHTPIEISSSLFGGKAVSERLKQLSEKHTIHFRSKQKAKDACHNFKKAVRKKLKDDRGKVLIKHIHQRGNSINLDRNITLIIKE